MKNIIYIVIIMPMFCFSQTKSDTESWIKFYLNKYFTDNRTFNQIGDVSFLYKEKGAFGIDSDSLLHCAFSTLNNDSISKGEIISFPIKNIKKVSYFIDSDSSNFSCHFVFDFDQQNTRKYTISVYNPITKEEGKGWEYPNYMIQSTDKNVLNDNLLPRLIKAFNHLVELDNGKILKEVF